MGWGMCSLDKLSIPCLLLVAGNCQVPALWKTKLPLTRWLPERRREAWKAQPKEEGRKRAKDGSEKLWILGFGTGKSRSGDVLDTTLAPD